MTTNGTPLRLPLATVLLVLLASALLLAGCIQPDTNGTNPSATPSVTATPTPAPQPVDEIEAINRVADLQELFLTTNYSYDAEISSLTPAGQRIPTANYSFGRKGLRMALYMPSDDNTTIYANGNKTIVCKAKDGNSTCAHGELLKIDARGIAMIGMGGPFYYLKQAELYHDPATVFTVTYQGADSFLNRSCEKFAFRSKPDSPANALDANVYNDVAIVTCYDRQHGFALYSTYSMTPAMHDPTKMTDEIRAAFANMHQANHIEVTRANDDATEASVTPPRE